MELLIEYLDCYNKEWGELNYKHPDDSGFDIRAAISTPITLEPGQHALISNGIKIEFKGPFPFPDEIGYELQIRPRSGLAAKHGISIVNTPGTVDFGYRGELKSTLINLGKEPFTINPGDRIAQAVVCPIIHPKIISTHQVQNNSMRGENGFGSTGKN